MLRVRLCATHVNGFLGPTFSTHESLFSRLSLNRGGFGRNSQRMVKNWQFSTISILKMGMKASFGN